MTNKIDFKVVDGANNTLDFEDLRRTGFLWLINRTVFHPRGFAFALVYDENDNVVGWTIYGDGTEPWAFDSNSIDEDALFHSMKNTFDLFANMNSEDA